MKTLEAATQLGCFNQHLPMTLYDNQFPYSEPHWHKDDDIDALLYSVRAHGGTTTVELIVVTKTLLTCVYAIGSKSGIHIYKILQYLFY